ncbi:hypothetical protein [Citrobacter koseri]|uniref:hypothetical protein n=1 Tax=Citrobacter koseri TaxID=545 RepID=UPI001F29BE03|nr:hypothetical protein [Citrobacter koseri]
MNKILLIALMASVFTLTACDNAAQKKREECTKANREIEDAFFLRVDKSVGHAAQEKWKELQCTNADIIKK